MRYKDAGVDPDRKARLIGQLRSAFESTHGDAVVRGIGAFSGVFRAPHGGFLVATADGVGTKVLIAREMGRDAETARDLVHHCVNDCIAVGATPLFLLDYIAFGVIEAERLGAIVAGLTSACRAHGIALLGGETAEMPGVYAESAYDLVGFLVGHASQDGLFDPAGVAAGDVVIGLASAGLHTNGYSLARKIIRDGGLDLARTYPGCDAPLGDLLMSEHRSYAAAIDLLRARCPVRSVAHITGGGIPENLPRAFPANLRARLVRSRWRVPPVMTFLAREGAVPDEEMLRAWNCGIGLAVIVPEADARTTLEALAAAGYEAWEIGAIEAGAGGVVFA